MRPKIHPLPILVTMAALALVRASATLAETPSPPPLEARIIWSDSGDSPRFLSAAVLASPSLFESEGGAVFSRAATQARDQFDRAAARFPRCSEPPLGCGFGNAGPIPERSIQDLVDRADTAVVGEVTSVTAGWGVPDHQVVSLVELVVERILTRFPGDPREPGRRVTYIQEGGTLRIGQQQACGRGYEGFATAARGDRILLIGAVCPRHASHVHRWYVFPVRDGVVMPQPYLHVSREPIQADSLRPRTTR